MLCLWYRQSLYYCLGYHNSWGTCWGQKMAGWPFRWEHICMVIDVILLSPPLPSVRYPPAQPLIATDPPSRLRTHAALQSAFMLVDFRRFWCHNEGGWRFDMAPLEFHAPCVSNRLRRSAGRYSRNWSFIASARGDYQPPPEAGMGQPRRRRRHQTPSLPWTSEPHFSRHLIWKHGSNPANLFQIQRDPGWYTIYSCSGLFK